MNLYGEGGIDNADQMMGILERGAKQIESENQNLNTSNFKLSID